MTDCLVQEPSLTALRRREGPKPLQVNYIPFTNYVYTTK